MQKLIPGIFHYLPFLHFQEKKTFSFFLSKFTMLVNNDNNAMVILCFWNDFKMISFLRKKNKKEKGKSSEKNARTNIQCLAFEAYNRVVSICLKYVSLP